MAWSIVIKDAPCKTIFFSFSLLHSSVDKRFKHTNAFSFSCELVSMLTQQTAVKSCMSFADCNFVGFFASTFIGT